MATTMTSLNTKLSVEEKDAFVRNTAALGLTPSAAVKVFVHMFNECGGFPFEVSPTGERRCHDLPLRR